MASEASQLGQAQAPVREFLRAVGGVDGIANVVRGAGGEVDRRAKIGGLRHECVVLTAFAARIAAGGQGSDELVGDRPVQIIAVEYGGIDHNGGGLNTG